MQERRQTVKDYFGGLLQDEGQREVASLLDVREVCIHKQDRLLHIDACTRHLISPAWRRGLQEALEEGMEGQLKVDLSVDYEAAEKTDLCEDAWHLASGIRRETASYAGAAFKRAGDADCFRRQGGADAAVLSGGAVKA